MSISGTFTRIFVGCVAAALLAQTCVAYLVDEHGISTAGFWTRLLLAVLISLPLAWLIARRLRFRLRSLRRAAEAITRGELTRRIYDHAQDETGRLATAFNTMAVQLQERLEALHLERDKLESIVTGMVEGLIATDRQERIVRMNAAAERILGVREQDAIGRPIWEATRFPKMRELVEEAMRGAQDTRIEITQPAQGGDTVVELRASALTNENGQLNGAVVVMHDVSQMRRLEGMRRNFVSNVSHELKTPLMAIHGIVETLLDDPSMDAEIRIRFLARLRNQSDRLASLVHDLLELSRVETISHSDEYERFDFRLAVRSALEHAGPYAAEKDIHIDNSEWPEELWVQGDGEMLRQLADNLLQNAIQYTPGDGEVRVATRAEGRELVFEVEDTGIGIEAKHLERIFERFYRVDKARSRELGGTGLGLSIVKHVAIAHEGSVDVRSEPGAGTCFVVRIPLAIARGAEAKEAG